MTARPDIDTAAEWLAHKRAERWAAVLTVADTLWWSVVVPSIVVGVMFAVFGVAR